MKEQVRVSFDHVASVTSISPVDGVSCRSICCGERPSNESPSKSFEKPAFVHT